MAPGPRERCLLCWAVWALEPGFTLVVLARMQGALLLVSCRPATVVVCMWSCMSTYAAAHC